MIGDTGTLYEECVLRCCCHSHLRQVVKTVKPNKSHTWIMSLKLLWLSFGLSEIIKQCGMCIQAWSFSASTAPRGSMLIPPAALLFTYDLSFLLQGMRY